MSTTLYPRPHQRKKKIFPCNILNCQKEGMYEEPKSVINGSFLPRLLRIYLFSSSAQAFTSDLWKLWNVPKVHKHNLHRFRMKFCLKRKGKVTNKMKKKTKKKSWFVVNGILIAGEDRRREAWRWCQCWRPAPTLRLWSGWSDPLWAWRTLHTQKWRKHDW